MDELEDSMAREAARQASEEGTTTDTADTSTQGDNAADAVQNNENDKPENAAAAADANKDQNTENKEVVTPPANQDTDAAFIANLERLSGGTIKTTADLQAALTKVGDYDSLAKRAEELEEKTRKTVFADPYEEKRNELKLAGATKEQLKAFEKINDLGDLNDLDPIEAKIMKLVLIEGYGEKVARAKVLKEFDLENTFDEDLEIMKADLEISAKGDKKLLEAFKTEVSTPNADSKILDAAQRTAVEEGLKPVLADFTEKFNVLTTFNLKGKNSDQVVPFDVDMDADGKALMATSIKDYMLNNNLPLTQENYNEAMSYARREYLEANQDKIVQKVWSTAEAHFTKLLSEKYENTSGLPRQDRKPAGSISEDAAAMKAVKKELLEM